MIAVIPGSRYACHGMTVPFSECSSSLAYGPARLRNGTPFMTTTDKRRDIVLSCVAACLIVAIVAVMAS